jgi:hypothetical protein
MAPSCATSSRTIAHETRTTRLIHRSRVLCETTIFQFRIVSEGQIEQNPIGDCGGGYQVELRRMDHRRPSDRRHAPSTRR